MDIKVKDCNDCIFCGTNLESSNPFTCLINRKRIFTTVEGDIIVPEWCPLKNGSVTVILEGFDETREAAFERMVQDISPTVLPSNIVWRNKNNERLFEYDKRTNTVLCFPIFVEIYKKKFNMRMTEIHEFLTPLLEKHLRLNGIAVGQY